MSTRPRYTTVLPDTQTRARDSIANIALHVNGRGGGERILLPTKRTRATEKKKSIVGI